MEIAKTLLECLEMIEDPRASYNRKHHFMDIMTIAILSVISGADTWENGAPEQGRVRWKTCHTRSECMGMRKPCRAWTV